MCSAFTPACGYDNSTIILIGDVYWPKIKCTGKHCLHKNTFQSLGRSNCQCPQCASVLQVRNILFEDQTNYFFCCSAKGFLFSKRVQNQFTVLLEMRIVLASFVSEERNACLLTVMQHFRDPFTVVESAEPGCLFTEILLC